MAELLDFGALAHRNVKISVFETTIRELGGLLGAHSLTGDVVFQIKAVELAELLLLPAFDERYGIFFTLFTPRSQRREMNMWAGWRALIADIGTLQLEMRYLSHITGDPTYADKVHFSLTMRFIFGNMHAAPLTTVDRPTRSIASSKSKGRSMARACFPCITTSAAACLMTRRA